MPINQNKIICLNDSNHNMLREADNFVFVTILKDLDPNGLPRMDLGNGLPVTIYHCEQCGYLETYFNPKAIDNMKNKTS